MTASWLHGLALLSLALGIACGLLLVLSVWRKPPHMPVMGWVWPLVGLFAGPLALWLKRRHGSYPHGKAPFALQTAVAACHCGAGCSLGDLLAETLTLAWPGLLVLFGLGSLWGDKIYAAWTLDFVLAYLLGIVFQFFSIAPMRGLGLKDGLVAAIKADTLSLVAWQVGMYGFMAVVQFGIVRLEASQAEFWFAMQLAMLAGFAVAYPVNWWLLKAGVKEAM